MFKKMDRCTIMQEETGVHEILHRCMYIYIYKQLDIQMYKQLDRQMYRQLDLQTYMQMGRQDVQTEILMYKNMARNIYTCSWTS